jgi:hypothetical protein
MKQTGAGVYFKKTCLGKHKHNSKGAAEAHLRAMEKVSQDEMVAYVCPFCRKWHVGHQIKRRRINASKTLHI